MSNIEIKNKNKYNNLNFIKQLSVKEILEIDGYVRYNCDISASEEDIKIIEKEFNNLKRDKYALENTQRHRAYSNAIILPWLNNKIVWLPVIIEEGEELSIYDQGNNNPEHTEVRYFNAISQESKDTKLLNDLIISDFKNTIGLNMSSPIFVGVHFVNTFCDNSKRQGVASPDTLHQDGEPFTFAHLFCRNDYVDGGINYISTPENRNKKPEDVKKDEILAKFTLNEFLDSFAIYDEKVSHYVSPVKTTTEGVKAERKIILIDFCNSSQELN